MSVLVLKRTRSGCITTPLQSLHKCCFDKNASWCTRSAHDFARFVLLRTLRGLLLQALPLNWIHSKIISAATFRIIGLIKLAKIEFLPLDWIYRSIRIMTVCIADQRLSRKCIKKKKIHPPHVRVCAHGQETSTQILRYHSGPFRKQYDYHRGRITLFLCYSQCNNGINIPVVYCLLAHTILTYCILIFAYCIFIDCKCKCFEDSALREECLETS